MEIFNSAAEADVSTIYGYITTLLSLEDCVNSRMVITKFAYLKRFQSQCISFNSEDVDIIDGKEQSYRQAGAGLAGCLNIYDSLRVSLNGWYLDDQILRNISKGFGKLRSLRLHDCKIGPEDCRTLALTLQSNNSIRTLDLSYNQIIGVTTCRGVALGRFDPSGISDLLDSLQGCKVQTLDLSGNYLGGIRCTAYSKANSANSDKMIADDYNTSGTIIAKLLEKFLLTNRTVKSLNLNANEFNDDDDEVAQILLLSDTAHHSSHSDNNDRMDRIGSTLAQTGAQISVGITGCRRRTVGSGTRFNGGDEAVRRSSRITKGSESAPVWSPSAAKPAYFPTSSSSSFTASPSSSSSSSSSAVSHCSSIPSNSPCVTLCGIQLTSLKTDPSDSCFQPSKRDLVDLSNCSLDSMTGRLLGINLTVRVL